MLVTDILLVLLINILISFILIFMLYVLSVRPMSKQLELLRVESQRHLQTKIQHVPLAPNPPANMLPSMDDIPDEIFYGEEEQKYLSPDEVEDDLAGNTTYNHLELDEANAWKQLSSLKTNAETQRVHNRD